MLVTDCGTVSFITTTIIDVTIIITIITIIITIVIIIMMMMINIIIIITVITTTTTFIGRFVASMLCISHFQLNSNFHYVLDTSFFQPIQVWEKHSTRYQSKMLETTRWEVPILHDPYYLLPTHPIIMTILSGLVVKASAIRAAHRVSIPALSWIFFQIKSCQWHKN